MMQSFKNTQQNSHRVRKWRIVKEVEGGTEETTAHLLSLDITWSTSNRYSVMMKVSPHLGGRSALCCQLRPADQELRPSAQLEVQERRERREVHPRRALPLVLETLDVRQTLREEKDAGAETSAGCTESVVTAAPTRGSRSCWRPWLTLVPRESWEAVLSWSSRCGSQDLSGLTFGSRTPWNTILPSGSVETLSWATGNSRLPSGSRETCRPEERRRRQVAELIGDRRLS